MSIKLGFDRETQKPVYFPPKAFERHLHLIGYTGAGKTTAIITLLVNMLTQRSNSKCVIIIDRLGGFSLDLLRWFSSPLLCPPWVQDRLLYIEPAREDVTISLNPLVYQTPGEGYYRTARAAEIVLRGWDSQDLAKMPRLMKWLFNSMWAVAQMGLTLTDTQHLLFPKSRYHQQLLQRLPPLLMNEWGQIMSAGNQPKSNSNRPRNRMKPYFDSPVLKAMFASPVNRLNVLEWMREKKVVVINLAPMGRLPDQSADTIGGLIVNEVFAVARSLPPELRQDTLLVLDEFQRFIGPDLEFSLAESSQLKTSLVLSHQSFSQLERGDTDLTSLIFQAQSRLMLRVAGNDAKILSEELNEFSFDPMKIKDELYTRSQRVSGHKLVELHSSSNSEQLAEEWSRNFGTVLGDTRGRSGKYLEPLRDRTLSESQSQSVSRGESEGFKESKWRTHGTSQSYLPIYEEYSQLASRTYSSFEEQRAMWGQKLRRLMPGEGILQIANDNNLLHLTVERTAPAHLGVEWGTVLKDMPMVADNYHKLMEKNFSQGCFVTPQTALQEAAVRLGEVLGESITVRELSEPSPGTEPEKPRPPTDPPPRKNPYEN
ncbi:MAG: DUF87 domain-containing protein [Gemmataceae bacterium]